MGASTSLLYASKHTDIAAMVLDSPFARFSVLFKDIAGGFGIPEFFVKGFYNFARENLETKHEIDIEKLNPIEGLDKVKIPALFIHASNDKLVLSKHSDEICAVYGGPKEKVNFTGIPLDNAHNAPRPEEVCTKIFKFLITNAKA